MDRLEAKVNAVMVSEELNGLVGRLKGGLRPKPVATIHEAGSAEGTVLSHWQPFVRSIGLDGADWSKAYRVVLLDSECTNPGIYFSEHRGSSRKELPR